MENISTSNIHVFGHLKDGPLHVIKSVQELRRLLARAIWLVLSVDDTIGTFTASAGIAGQPDLCLYGRVQGKNASEEADKLFRGAILASPAYGGDSTVQYCLNMAESGIVQRSLHKNTLTFEAPPSFPWDQPKAEPKKKR
jgi:hypothetical protein